MLNAWDKGEETLGNTSCSGMASLKLLRPKTYIYVGYESINSWAKGIFVKMRMAIFLSRVAIEKPCQPGLFKLG
jgi:hypothetical protein